MTPSGLREHSLDLPIGLRHRLGDGNVVSFLHCMNDPQPEGHMASHVGRRKFLATLGGAAAWPLAAGAQQGGGMRRIGVLMGTAQNDPDQKTSLAALLEGLAALDWRDGRNIHIEYRWAAGDPEQLRTYAAELGALSLEVVLTQGTPATAALRQAASTIPIVFVSVTDPVGSGLVVNLAHPGGNITGFSNYETSMGG